MRIFVLLFRTFVKHMGNMFTLQDLFRSNCFSCGTSWTSFNFSTKWLQTRTLQSWSEERYIRDDFKSFVRNSIPSLPFIDNFFQHPFLERRGMVGRCALRMLPWAVIPRRILLSLGYFKTIMLTLLFLHTCIQMQPKLCNG